MSAKYKELISDSVTLQTSIPCVGNKDGYVHLLEISFSATSSEADLPIPPIK